MRTRPSLATLALWCCLAATASVIVGCGDGDTCAPPEAIQPIRVDVTNAATGEKLCDVRVTARSGDREAVLLDSGGCTYAGGWGPGTYDVRAEKDGFAPATRTGVQIRDLSDECTRWDTVHLTIDLMPL